jgi:putative transposase
VNKKLVYRLYCEEGLEISRRKPRRRKSVQVREARSIAQRANDSWGMDFVSDQLVGGQRFRLLTLKNYSCESLAIEVGQRLTGDDVVRVLEQVTMQRGKPKSIRVDNGPEFISRSPDLWPTSTVRSSTSATTRHIRTQAWIGGSSAPRSERRIQPGQSRL